MLCSLLNRDLGFVCRSVLGFLDRSISSAMGCFIGCFRVRDDRRHGSLSQPPLVAESSQPKLTEVVISQNRLSSLFLSEDKEDSPSKDKGTASVATPEIDNQLKKEAKFLKACGTLAETPIEIRKASSKFDGSSVHGQESGSSKFHSWLPDASIEKLQLHNQLDQPPTPCKLSEERVMISASLEQTPSSGSVSSIHNRRRVSFSSTEGSGTSSISTAANIQESDTPLLSATNAQHKSKSVRFDCDSELSSSKGSSSGNNGQNSKKDESLGSESILKPSAYPTPRKLSDEMQTPGTVFPANLDNIPNGRTRIRSQYVYPVLNPIESVSQWKVLKEEDPNSHQLSDELRESLDQPKDATPISKERAKETSLEEIKIEASLSSWLKPVRSTQDGNNQNFVGISDRPRVARTPMDRPIIGMVAAHWNEEEPSRISPKWWDGNGIPNSTNKYKEDQKVSWHATPFEERLEKALSEESFISQRKPMSGTPIMFDENEESDTALSQLHSSSHPKSVVSC